MRSAPTRCSRWRWSGCRGRATCARSPPSAGWRTCPTTVCCCAWGAPWSGSTAPPSRRCPKRITLDIDDTFDAVHGGQQLRLFNAHYDEYGFQPIVVFDGAGRFVAAVLRPAKRPKGCEIAAHLRRLVREIRSHWPRVEILIRGDGHYCAPEVLDICRAHGVDFILGLPATSTLRRHVATLEASTTARAEAAGGKLRRFKEFHDGAASWSRVERIIARVEAGPQGCDTRFIVTSLAIGTGKTLYEGVYCARGQAENHIKAWKAHLAADRTSCSSAAANQLRLFLHAGAYWLMWTLRAALPKRSPWRRAQFDTLRLRLIKIAARVVELKSRITLHLPSACPAAPLMRLVLTQAAAHGAGLTHAPTHRPRPPGNRNPKTEPPNAPRNRRARHHARQSRTAQPSPKSPRQTDRWCMIPARLGSGPAGQSRCLSVPRDLLRRPRLARGAELRDDCMLTECLK